MITLPITCKQLFFITWLLVGIGSLILMIYHFESGMIVLIMTMFTGIALAWCGDYIPIRCRCG